MKVKALFFGSLADAVSGQTEQIIENVKTTEDLILVIKKKYPLIKKYTYKVAVNQEMTYTVYDLKDNDEIAFLPPFAGG